jgi:hypothetical protein
VSRANAGILGSVLQFVRVVVAASKDCREVDAVLYGLLLVDSVRVSGRKPVVLRAAEVGERGAFRGLAAILGGLL